MGNKKQNRFKDLGAVKKVRIFTQSIKIPGYVDLSLYSLIKTYASGLVKGALAARAGSVAFSFFSGKPEERVVIVELLNVHFIYGEWD